MGKYDLLAKWFKKRFGRDPKSDPVYFDEWKYRLNTGEIEAFMDSKSKRIWREMKKSERMM